MAGPRLICGPAGGVCGGGETPHGAFVIMEGQAKLFQVIRAAHPACGFSGGLDCRQQKADEDSDDGDDDEEFDQGKAEPRLRRCRAFLVLDEEFHFLNSCSMGANSEPV